MKKILLNLFFIFLLPIDASASLMINPTRIEFDYVKDENQVKNVRLFNSSDSKKSYRISFQHLRMSEKGELVEIKNPSSKDKEKFVDDIILYSPKRVTLDGKSSQVIRLMLKKNPNLPAGEYRSHLLIAEEDDSNKALLSKSENGKKISVEIRALLSTSIPVIVNNGAKNSKLEFGEISVGENEILVELLRSGNSTIHGDVIALANGKEIASISSISVFYPHNKRKISLKPKNKLDAQNIELFFYERVLINGEYEINKSKPLIRKTVSSKNS
jgi:hypothetical protein